MAVFPCVAEEQLGCRLLLVDDGDPAAHNPVLRQNRIEALRKSVCLCARRCCSDQGAREQRSQAMEKGFDMRVMIIRLPYGPGGCEDSRKPPLPAFAWRIPGLKREPPRISCTYCWTGPRVRLSTRKGA